MPSATLVKKEEKEEALLGTIRMKIVRIYNKFGAFRHEKKLKDPKRFLEGVIKLLYKVSKQVELAVEKAERLHEPELVRMLNITFKRLEIAHGFCLDMYRGKGDYRHNASEANSFIEGAMVSAATAEQIQERLIKSAA